MAKKVWTINLEDGNHTIELEHSYFSGRRKITVDGKVLEETAKVGQALFDTGSQHPFQINGHSCVVMIRTNGITFNYHLTVDGYSTESGKKISQSEPMPTWAWIFIFACGIIPIISFGGAVPAAIGFGGAAGCLSIVKDASKSMNTKLAICAGITVLCWALFGILIIATAGFWKKP